MQLCKGSSVVLMTETVLGFLAAACCLLTACGCPMGKRHRAACNSWVHVKADVCAQPKWVITRERGLVRAVLLLEPTSPSPACQLRIQAHPHQWAGNLIAVLTPFPYCMLVLLLLLCCRPSAVPPAMSAGMQKSS